MADTKAPEKEAPKEVVAPKVTAVPLTSLDRFILKDTNNDGIPDIVVVEPFDKEAEAARVESAKYAGYFTAIEAAKDLASKSTVGRSAKEVQAAINVAEAKAKADWKGVVPPATKEDKAKVEADKAAAADKLAYETELAKLNAK